MQVPKFKEFLTETDVSRRDKPMTVAIVTVADSKTQKKILLLILYQKLVRKKVSSVL